MKLGIMQPYFFPYIGYWQLMNLVDKYVIYDDVNFIKNGWINRNKILVNGNPSYFTMPLIGASSFKKINEIQVNNSEIQYKKMLRTIEQNYKKAPYFDDIFPIIEDILKQNNNNLAKFLEYSIRKIANYLDFNTEIILSSTIEKNNELRGKDKVISICRILNADEYVNAIGGTELYSFEDFKDNNIKLQFLKTESIEYTQFKNEFVPNLSIIDVIMFNSKEEIQKMLNEYTIVDK